MEIQRKKGKFLKNETVGDWISTERLTDRIIIETSNAYLLFQYFGSSCVRVHTSRISSFDHYSYAVIQSADQSCFRFSEDEEKIEIETSDFRTEISKFPVRVKHCTLDRRTINEEDPALGSAWLGEQGTSYRVLHEGERFIGLGEKVGNLDRKGTGYTHWNNDAFAYGPSSDPLYCTIPFYIGIHNQLTYGLFLDNPVKSHFNFGASNNRFSSFTAEDGDLNTYFFFSKKGIPGILAAYADLTGKMPMPPKWSLGYQQARYSYYPESEVLNVAQTFREKKIPADTIVLDIHYMDQYKIFSWDNERFPNPAKMIAKLKEDDFNVVVIMDPGIKEDHPDYDVYKSGIEEDVFVKYPDGTNYAGEVWPGWCNFPDFTDPKCRMWWKNQMEFYTKDGIDGFWNDMNEIATWGNQLPDLIVFNNEGDPASAKQLRNVYGSAMSRSTYEAAKELLNKRPFNLTRSAYAGIQRHAAVWTGDNVPNDDHMMLGVRLLSSMGVSGIPFAGYDVGGFAGDSSVKLYARWIILGAFSPFFRGHTMVNTSDAEPWAFGEEVEEISRNFINLRYRLMPYIYSNFNLASRNGLPLNRTLAIDFPHDPNVYDLKFQNQYFFGDSILVCPVRSDQDFVKVYLPKYQYYNLKSDKLVTAGQHIAEAAIDWIPIYVKESSIIPMQELTQSVKQVVTSPLEIHIYKGSIANSFELYEDDGASFDFEDGAFFKRTISYDPSKGKIVFAQVNGTYQSNHQHYQLMLHGFNGIINQVKVNGEPVSSYQETIVLLPAVSKFDPVGTQPKSDSCIVTTFIIENDHNLITIDL